MIMHVYSIHDAATQVFTRPFFALTSGEAIRSFSDAMKDPNLPFFRHTVDYSLFQIGTYDDTIGQIDPILPIKLGTGDQYAENTGDNPHA